MMIAYLILPDIEISYSEIVYSVFKEMKERGTPSWNKMTSHNRGNMNRNKCWFAVTHLYSESGRLGGIAVYEIPFERRL